MAHNHDHHDHSHGAPQSFNFAFACAILFNFAFTLTQIVYAFKANSSSLLADAAHNFGDVCGLVLAWGANWLLTLPARKRYSYGYKRTTILAALINGIILVTSSAIIAYESIGKLMHSTHINGELMIIIAALGIVINGGSALLFMKGSHHDLNIKGAFLHLLADALISIGVVITGVCILFTGWTFLDALVSLLIVMIILIGTWGLLRDSVGLIMDAIPHYIDHHGIEHYLQNLSGVTAVHDLHIWGLSTKEVALTVHLIMPTATLSDADYQKINQILKEKFRVNHATIQVEKGSSENPCVRSEKC
jgi:cobalt-zinc-cadmium efflux system protein